jgi:hypothetical protein
MDNEYVLIDKIDNGENEPVRTSTVQNGFGTMFNYIETIIFT